MSFDLGGFSFRLSSSNASWVAMAAERFADFQVPRDEGAIPIRYTVTGPKATLDPQTLWAARKEPLEGRRDGEVLEIRGFAFRAWLAPGGVEIHGPLALYPLDLVLRVLWYERMAEGLMVHGAALVEDGRGFLCTGPSGSGKSTLAGLFPEAALSDELAGVFWPAEGEASPESNPGRLDQAALETTRGACLSGLPYWRGRAGQAGLRAVHLLVHGHEDRLRELPLREACARLRSQIIWPSWDQTAMRRALGTFSRLFGEVPIYELSFRPAEDVWPVLALEAA